ncbi:hypothetical protein PC116_g19478 [Phytophthora cactorum]|uniref:Uncharacterized protein n=1 Tax=Phytophthora cactorum TaxID=29920 RepID=A0A8T1KAC5_9STRA|nr:hypothetical protein PC113_g18706 [Phytophthora cactorum]KAG2894710.1 hypothetical protein PC115_g18067 [Phytophthora cactorum]KAG4232278.1 hypothetical protein PC116_g19478 [Phytophthora cactorum]
MQTIATFFIAVTSAYLQPLAWFLVTHAFISQNIYITLFVLVTTAKFSS